MKGRYRWQILLKGRNIGLLRSLARQVLERGAGRGLSVKADVDPLHFM
ncbi:MAG: hypothetical protein ACE14T_11445 [Syntrophales bacterium]